MVTKKWQLITIEKKKDKAEKVKCLMRKKCPKIIIKVSEIKCSSGAASLLLSSANMLAGKDYYT